MPDCSSSLCPGRVEWESTHAASRLLKLWYTAGPRYKYTSRSAVLRRTQPQRRRPYRMSGYPVTLLVFAAVALGFVVNTFVTTPGPALVGTLLIAAGVPVYFIWKRNG